MKVIICMGSKSDWDVVSPCAEILKDFAVEHEVRILSAHRIPEKMLSAAKNFESEGFDVVIAAAGGAAHLPGMLASNTILPVIGIPVHSRNSILGIDSLLSIVQMPSGVPVASMAVNGAENAALFAVQILARKSSDLSQKLHQYKEALKDKVQKQQESL